MYGTYLHFQNFQNIRYGSIAAFSTAQDFALMGHGDQFDHVYENVAHFGLVLPILVNDNHQIILGRHRFEALRQLGELECPIIYNRMLSGDTLAYFACLDLTLMLTLPEWKISIIEPRLRRIFSSQRH